MAFEPVYRGVIGALVATFTAQRWTVRTTGGEHVPRTGGAIVATNHVGYLDFVVSGYSVRDVTPDKRLVRYAAKKEVFDHPVSGPLMRAMKHIPVDRGAGAASSTIDVAVEKLRAGELVGMFPESTISRSFVPLPGRTGTVRMAQAAGVPIVPGAIWGSQRLYTKGRSPKELATTRRVLVTVDWSEPMWFDADEDPQVGTDRLMERLGSLVDTASRNYPDRPARGEDPWWVPAHLGGTAPTPEPARARAEAAAAERRAKRASEEDARRAAESGGAESGGGESGGSGSGGGEQGPGAA